MKSFPRGVDVGWIGIEQLLRPLEAVAFWCAIALPFLHIPLLLHGLETSGELFTFLGLLALNGIAIVVGHRHKRD